MTNAVKGKVCFGFWLKPKFIAFFSFGVTETKLLKNSFGLVKKGPKILQNIRFVYLPTLKWHLNFWYNIPEHSLFLLSFSFWVNVICISRFVTVTYMEAQVVLQSLYRLAKIRIDDSKKQDSKS